VRRKRGSINKKINKRKEYVDKRKLIYLTIIKREKYKEEYKRRK